VCRYTAEALDTWPGGTPLLSCSLPLGSRPHKDAGVYFRGMLPEGHALQAMAAEANVATYDTFGMLARFGRDVAGAAIIGTEDPEERIGGMVSYTTDALAEEVSGLEDRPLAIYDDSELSLAGLQNKLLLIASDDGGWARPTGGRPSTHILKLEDRRYPGLVAMEAACLRLARSVELTSIDVRVDQFAGLDCLIVSRFDRVAEASAVDRVHQEDACQALGRDPEANDRKGKYESSGGPALREIAELLDRHAADPLPQLRQLVRVVTYNVVIGNADAHGKNISLLHLNPGEVVLAPLYDTVPTALWPKLPTRAAMFVNQRESLADVDLDDIVEEARAWRIDPSEARAIARETAEKLRASLDDADAPRDLRSLVTNRVTTLLS
jgi:serine/threonine-protein kinase HipA